MSTPPDSSIPSWLETPPQSKMHPPVKTLTQELPFKELGWEDFERLCLRLVRLEAQVEHCQFYGERGEEQEGIDIYARHLNNSYRVYQCKREKNFGPSKLRNAVEKFLRSSWAAKADTFVLCTQEKFVTAARAKEVETQSQLLREKGITFLIWDSQQLSMRLKEIPQLVADFFGTEWAKAFCGEEHIKITKSVPSTWPEALDIQTACEKITNSSINEVIDNQPTVIRHGFREEIDQFLTSSTRYGFVIGSSGVGKSTALSIEAKRLLEAGWAVLLLPVLPGNLFSLNYAAELINQQLNSGSAQLQWPHVLQPWAEIPDRRPSNFVLIIDGIDEAEPDHIARQLSLLHYSIINAPLSNLKVLLSCRDIEWERLMQNSFLPFYVEAESVARPARRGYQVLTLSEFISEELDSALQKIGADELLVLGTSLEHTDPHVATLRDLLKHPATFEHFANLYATGDTERIQNVTWSALIDSRLRNALRDVARACKRNAHDLKNDLISFTQVCWEQQARDFSLDIENVKDAFPHLFIRHEDISVSPYEAFLRCGVLLQTSASESMHLVRFRITDVGGFLLSFCLERLATANHDVFHEMATKWLHEAWNYSPLLDAMLAWIDRMSFRPRSPQLLLLLKAILHTHRSNSLFRLMRPAVLGSLFELVKHGDSNDYWMIRDAAVEVRSSLEVLTVIRRHIHDPDTDTKRLALKLAALHHDENSIPDFIRLLEDQDREVRHEVFVGFGRFGRVAVAPLLDALNDFKKSAQVRSRYLWAISDIGYRDDKISEAISQCIARAQSGDTELLRSAFLTAANLRDRKQTSHAITALKHSDRKVIQAAAKLLTEAPDPAAFDTLREVCRPQISEDGSMVARYWHHSQLIAAFIRANPLMTEPIVVEMIRQGFEGTGEFSESEAVNVAKKFALASAYPLILNKMVSELEDKAENNILWRTSEGLGKAWRWEQLELLIAETAKLSSRGTDIARLLVDEIAPNMQIHDELPMGDRLNRTTDLHTIIKCQAVNFIPEACRLLQSAPNLSTEDICRLLWIAGDIRAEDALLDKLEHTPLLKEHTWYTRNTIVRALGTCATARGAKAVLSFLCSDQNISYYFHQEVLHPLLKRKLIKPKSLVEIVEDSKASVGGRIASLLALGVLNAKRYKNVFLRKTGDSEDDLVQLYAVRLLGFTKDASVVSTLRSLLRESSRPGIRSQAAEALGWLNAKEAVHDIEEAVEDAESLNEGQLSGFLNALTRFREKSSLELLLDRLKTAPSNLRRYYLEALGAFAHEPQGRKVIHEQFEECTVEQLDVYDNQGSLLSGLTAYAPNMLLESFSTNYDRGRLTSRGRQELVSSISRLFHEDSTDKTLLMEMIKRLVCDEDVAVRDRAMHALRFTDTSFCESLYNELLNAPNADEWRRACAVQTLAFWECDVSRIEAARYDKEFLIRRAADEALKVRQERYHLQRHLEQFREGNGLARLSSYLCLKKKGNLTSIWTLHESITRKSLKYTFVRHLTHEIKERLRNEYRKKQEEEEKLAESRGTIYFD